MEIVSVHLFDELPKPVINKSIQLVLAHHHYKPLLLGHNLIIPLVPQQQKTIGNVFLPTIELGGRSRRKYL